MQLHFRIRLISAIILSIFFVSCNKPNKQGKLIPKEAAFVLHIDGKSLFSKLPWQEIKQNPFLKKLYGDSTLSPAIKSLLDNPENSGIDTKTDLLFFSLKDSVGNYMAFEGTVKDADLFKTFNKQISGNGAESEKDGVTFISYFPSCVGWDKEKFVYVFDGSSFSKMDGFQMSKSTIHPGDYKSRDIGATCKTIFALKEDNALAKDEKFSKLMGETGDIHFWINTVELIKSIPSSSMEILNTDKLYNGNINTATINFDPGKISLDGKTYQGEEMTKLYKKYGGGKINEKMISKIPGKEIIAVMALNFKPQGIMEMIKMMNLDGIMNIGLVQMGLSLDDLMNANKGDILLAITGSKTRTDSALKKEPTEDTEMPFTNMPKVLFATSVGDKDAFNKLVLAGRKMSNSMGLMNAAASSISYNYNGNYFAIGNSKENVDNFLNGPESNFDFTNKMSGQCFGAYINFQTLFKTFKVQTERDSAAKVVYEASLKMWDNLYWKGGDMSNDAISQSIEINLVDKNSNSLQQLNHYIDTLSKVYEEKSNEHYINVEDMQPKEMESKDTSFSAKIK